MFRAAAVIRFRNRNRIGVKEPCGEKKGMKGRCPNGFLGLVRFLKVRWALVGAFFDELDYCLTVFE